ncbi:MAG TPA: TonB-dependent receptor [Thermoanaerobaculia bacterium]|nr:TonB-dependent receptor [Thermoanaerobaculia bacterium]
MALRSARLLILGLLFSLCAVSVFAARITGRVTRTDGSPVGGVIVNAIEASRGTLTEPNGSYVLEVPPGTYTLQFVAGDQSATESNVVVETGGAAKVDKQVDWNISIAETITVYSASRRTERVTEAPAAVTVIAQEDIVAVAPSGQAPRIVENAPGVDYTSSGLYDSNFNARGFNSSLNRRILTLIDGRDPAIAFLGAQEWAALSVPIDEMQSVELIRGPGSALYGANAFSGVLNMTTKTPRDTQGGRLMLSGGDLNTRRADIRHAGGFGSEWYYRVVGGYQNSGDFSRSRNAVVDYTIPCTTTVTTNCLPRELSPLVLDEVDIRFGGLRLDKHFANTNVFTVEGGYSTIEGPVFQTGIGRVQVTDVERPWARVNYNMPRWNFGAYYDSRKAENQVALASGAALYEDSHNIHAEVMTNWDFMAGRTRLVGGVAWNDQDVDTSNPAGFHTLMLEARSEQQQSAFGQLEFDVTKNIKLVGAGRYDDSTLHEAQFSPKAAIVLGTGTGHTFRYGYNEAFQRPNYSELFLAAPAGAPVNLAAAAALNPASAPLAPVLALLGFGCFPPSAAPCPTAMAILARGNSALDVEKVKAHEAGYAGIFGGKLYLTVDLYKSHLSNFVTDLLPGVNPAFPVYTVPTSLPAPVQAGVSAFLAAALGARRGGLTTVNGRPALVFSYTNAGEVDTQGGEIAFNYYVTNNWVVDANFSLFDFEVKSAQVGDRLLPNAPEKKFNAGLSWRGAKLDAKVSYRWVEEFDWAAGVFVGTVPQYDVVNLAANFHISDRFGVGVDVSNVFDDEHWEAFGGDLMSRRALGFVTLKW